MLQQQGFRQSTPFGVPNLGLAAVATVIVAALIIGALVVSVIAGSRGSSIAGTAAPVAGPDAATVRWAINVAEFGNGNGPAAGATLRP